MAVFKGSLVTLRPIEAGDHERIAAFSNDLEVMLLAGGSPPAPRSRARVASTLEQLAREETTLGFAIDADGTLIGLCMLAQLDPVSLTAQLEIVIGEREYWGRGYGREAVRLLVDYGFRLRNLRKIWLAVRANNPRAIRAYEAVGFTEEGRPRAHVWNDGDYVDLVYMGLFKRRRP